MYVGKTIHKDSRENIFSSLVLEVQLHSAEQLNLL